MSLLSFDFFLVIHIGIGIGTIITTLRRGGNESRRGGGLLLQ